MVTAEARLQRLGPWAGPLLLAPWAIVAVILRAHRQLALGLPGAALVVLAALLLSRWDDRELPFAGGAAAIVAGFVLACGSSANNVGWFGLCMLAGWAMFSPVRWVALAFPFATAAVFAGETLWGRADAGWAAWIAGVFASSLSAWIAARDRRLVQALRDAQADLAARSRAEERNRISRELHDVIAHSLTVSLLHVSSARLAVEHEPEEAVRALQEAERLGRESLDEVRSIVGMLRADGDAASTAPVPGAAALGELVVRFRTAGAEITLEDDGELARMPAVAGATVYRIAQEALTNAAKHAPGCAIAVDVRRDGGRLAVRVDSAGPAGRGPGGHGLSTMRERAEALGGSCEAGPAAGGWRVSAWLPLRIPAGGGVAAAAHPGGESAV